MYFIYVCLCWFVSANREISGESPVQGKHIALGAIQKSDSIESAYLTIDFMDMTFARRGIHLISNVYRLMYTVIF